MKALFALGLLAGSAQANQPDPPSPERWIGAVPAVIVSVAPGPKPGVFRATAYIIDSRAGQPIDSPSADGPAGDELYLEGKSRRA